jgi:hypothetical protein
MTYQTNRRHRKWSAIGAAVAFALASFSTYPGNAAATDYKLTLKSDQEVPPVQSVGTGSGTITINDDMTVSGSVTTSGIAGTKAHIHAAAAGKNGPVIVELKSDGDTWSVPAGSKLTAAQFASYKAGDLYVNVHTAANPKGDMRAQIKP